LRLELSPCANSDADKHLYSNGDFHANGDLHPNQYGNFHQNVYQHGYGNVNQHGYVHGYGDSHTGYAMCQLHHTVCDLGLMRSRWVPDANPTHYQNPIGCDEGADSHQAITVGRVMDATFWSEVSRFGAGIFIAIVVFIAYQQLVGKITDVIRSNTEILAEVKETLRASCDALRSHETATAPSRDEVKRTLDTAARIEAKVDKLHEEHHFPRRAQR